MRNLMTREGKVLFVDDEVAVLEGFRRTLHRECEVDTAVGGAEGLVALQYRGPYAIVVSDMRMPGMTGSQFLAQVRRLAPDTVRMLLTGYTDLPTAIEAVNQGQIFRFLGKPIDKDGLLSALESGFEQYRLITGERELLEKTLMGSVKVLSEVLGAASPEAFGRSARITQYVRHMMGTFKMPSAWRFEVAATLSQLGCVALDDDVLRAAYAGEKLAAEAQERFEAHPAAAMNLLASIPRMEHIAWMIGQQLKVEIPAVVPGLTGSWAQEILVGARMLKLAVAYEDQRKRLASDAEALTYLRSRPEEFEAALVNALSGFKHDGATRETHSISVPMLRPGMILDQEIHNHHGVLLMGRGQELTVALTMKIENFWRAGMIGKDVRVLVLA